MSCSELRVSVDIGGWLLYCYKFLRCSVATSLAVDYGSTLPTFLLYIAPYPCSSLTVAEDCCCCARHVLDSLGLVKTGRGIPLLVWPEGKDLPWSVDRRTHIVLDSGGWCVLINKVLLVVIDAALASELTWDCWFGRKPSSGTLALGVTPGLPGFGDREAESGEEI